MEDREYYGLISIEKDEKRIITGLNDYLATLNRTTSKVKNKSMLESHLPFVFKHLYFNLNEETGTYLAVFPNCDLRGEWIHKDHQECAWFIQAIRHDHLGYDEIKSPPFIKKSLESTGCEVARLTPNPVFDSEE